MSIEISAGVGVAPMLYETIPMPTAAAIASAHVTAAGVAAAAATAAVDAVGAAVSGFTPANSRQTLERHTAVTAVTNHERQTARTRH